MQNQTAINLSADKKASKRALLVGIKRLLTKSELATLLGCTCSGVSRFQREGRLPDGLLVRIGSEVRFNPEKAQAVINGELRILSVAEANAQGRFVSRAARADHEKRVAKQAAKAARAKVADELNNHTAK